MLLDVHLPDASGHVLIRQLERLNVPLPIIAISGRADRDDLVLLIRHGAVDFLEKPFRTPDLEAALDRLAISGRRLEAGSARERGKAPEDQPAPEETPTGAAARETAGADRADAAGAEPQRDDRSGDPTERVARQVERGQPDLPVLGPISDGIQRLLHRETCGVQEVVDVLEQDPSVTAQVLRAANTSYYRPARTLETLRDACVQLGNKRVLAVAQEALLAPLFALEEEPFGSVSRAMWANVLVTAHGARELSRRLELLQPDEVFLTALLHNVGELVLLRMYHQRVLDSPTGQANLDTFAELARSKHEAVGAKLLKAWGCPRSAVGVASHHHRRQLRPETRAATVRRQLVMLAWHGALQAGYDYLPGQPQETPPALLADLDLSQSDLDAVFDGAADWLTTGE